MATGKDKNEPGRFLGEGVSFRAKLIGVLEVPEARGDRMCQEALADLKMAIRAAGEHKQRIQVHVAIDGLRLRDDKTGDSLYHHPVHKISFIAQDMTDSRAFGYIFGSPDTGHRFFGIKTDKAASQVVIAMRDLFQVVFELKKKEVEMAKQQLEGKTVTSLARHTSTISETKLKQSLIFAGDTTSILKSAEAAEGGVAELVDLEQELSSLRRGLTQVEGLTPSTDPFGDSFIVPQSQKGLLPPPPSGANSRGRNTPASTKAVFSPNKTQLPFDLAPTEFEPSLVDNITEPPPVSTQAPTATSSLSYDVFTELDPLGTGRSKPYVDKKLFFQELKNPPKKVLNDLVPTTQSLLTDVPVATESKADYGPATSMTSLSRQSGGTVAVAKFGANYYSSDPFAETDPFDNTDPFSDTFKEDPFTSVHEFPKGGKDDKIKLSRDVIEKESVEEARGVKSVFNGPLQVSLPPEPAPKSPRLQRQNTDSSSIRQRPHVSKPTDNASPPPPLPPKKVDTTGRPPPRPPHEEREDKDEEGPPLPRPARKIGGEERLFGGQRIPSDRWAGSRWSRGTHSSSDEYLTPAPAPARRFDMTLAQLLTCPLPQLAARLRVPAETLSSMTLPQLTEYLRSYLAADIDRANINVEPSMEIENDRSLSSLNSSIEKPASATPPIKTEFKPQFEDNFAPTSETADGFVANFDDFDKKANPSYDRYAAFREIQEQELKTKSVLDPLDSNEDSKQDVDTDREELAQINNRVEIEIKDRSPLKSLDELTLDSLNMFRSSVSPKPIDAKIEDIKSVMKNLQIDTKARRSVSPRENNNVSDLKSEDYNDRYAALREITITEPPADEFESLPPEPPKERKKSDEKSDGFDNSDFFDCIDNSSLSFSHVEDAFRKSPVVKEREEEKKKVEDKTVVAPEILPVRELQPPTRLSTGSISDVASVSSLDAKERRVAAAPLGGSRWAVLGGAGSPCSSDSPPPRHKRGVQTSSSSRDASPWDEEPLRIARPSSHHSHSKHNSSGSRECLDSGSGRERDKKRDSRDRELSRDGRDSGRDRRDSGSGRDRRDLSKDRDHRDHRRERRSRDRDSDVWERDRTYSRDRDYHSRSRERGKDYRDKDRDRHRKARHSYDEDEDYSDGCESGRSSPRERWSDQRWRRDERNYGSLGWRESRRRPELRQSDSGSDRRYGSTLGWPGRRTSSRRDSDRDSRDTRDTRDVRDMRDVRDPRDMRDTRDSRDNRDARRRRRDEPRRRDYRFSNDFSPRDRDHPSPFDNDFQDTPTPTVKKRTPYSSLEGTRFAFDSEEPTASPLSVSSARARDPDSPATRFRFDSDSISPRSMFEDDFTAPPRGRTASIAEEDESDVPPLRTKPVQHRDIKKSESVNIFTRESDPFENDAFFACTGSDRVARRENWPGDFQGFNA